MLSKGRQFEMLFDAFRTSFDAFWTLTWDPRFSNTSDLKYDQIFVNAVVLRDRCNLVSPSTQ